jgi:hypothetical protein
MFYDYIEMSPMRENGFCMRDEVLKQYMILTVKVYVVVFWLGTLVSNEVPRQEVTPYESV